MVELACCIHSLSPRPRRPPSFALDHAHMFRTKNPSLSSGRALLAANVAPQIVKAMRTLDSESEAKAMPLIEAEFRKVLTSYLKGVLSEGKPAG